MRRRSVKKTGKTPQKCLVLLPEINHIGGVLRSRRCRKQNPVYGHVASPGADPFGRTLKQNAKIAAAKFAAAAGSVTIRPGIFPASRSILF
ncbi:hypothetical protein [Acidomonas methanolica]|uniref:hypothetical protein n=1 Tax=Acidomonas methanolica TaxID=437 RepID=UPI00130E4A70|nr:hypothetical protein [Acidomonas methanolica]